MGYEIILCWPQKACRKIAIPSRDVIGTFETKQTNTLLVYLPITTVKINNMVPEHWDALDLDVLLNKIIVKSYCDL